MIADLKNEVAHQDYRGPTGVDNHAPMVDGLLHNEDVLLLTQRVEQMERSVNRILPIVRKILYTVSERQSTAAARTARPSIPIPHIEIRHDPGFMCRRCASQLHENRPGDGGAGRDRHCCASCCIPVSITTRR